MLLAFAIGVLIHVVLLGLSLSGRFDFATFLLLVFALPGALVDISSEMIHPSQAGGILIATIATLFNGAAYTLAAWCMHRISRKRPGKTT